MIQQMTGLRAWIIQRLTALYMAGYLPYILGVWAFQRPDHYAAWRAMMAQPVTATANLLFFAAVLVHCWVGVRDIILDYAPSAPLRLGLLALLGLWLVGMGLWAARVLIAVMA